MPLVTTLGAASARGFGLFSSSILLDPYFNYNTLLLPGNGTNGAQNNTFLDSSTNNFTITRNGNTTQGTFTPYGSNWSAYFPDNGANNSAYITASISGALATTLQGSAQTREMWLCRTNSSSSNIGLFRLSGSDVGTLYFVSGNLIVYNGSAIISVSAATYVPIGVWTHIAVTLSGGVVTLWINGISVGTASGQSFSGSTGTLQLGGANDMQSVGYMSNVRVSNTARYSSTFTPSTTPFTSDANTTLLCFQSNRFIDTSSNNIALTIAVGSPSVQRFSPFNPSAPYAAGTIGGSGYFDGSGDSLQTPSNAAFTFGTGDFTLECWAYLSGNYPGVVSGIVDISTSNSTGRLVLDLYSTGYVNIETVGVSLVASNTLLPKNAWSHLVAVRSGTTLSLFQNGTRVGTATNSTNFSFSQAYVGVTSDGYYWSGYLSSVRLVKGTAVYDPSQSTLTVPTAPLTAITNTSLLLNMTNGGIIDNAMMNDLETVGNAQISTSVSKFGGGSMSFNGTNSYMPARPNDTNSFGTGDFTLEAWVYPSAFTSPNSTIACVWASTGYAWYFGLNGSTNVLFGYAGSTVSFAYTFSANNWYHIAITRSSGSVRAFVNGTQVGSTQTITSSLTANSTVLAIGANMDGGPTQYWNGYLDDLRITKGIARYTANFTPPTAAFPLS